MPKFLKFESSIAWHEDDSIRYPKNESRLLIGCGREN